MISVAFVFVEVVSVFKAPVKELSISTLDNGWLNSATLYIDNLLSVSIISCFVSILVCNVAKDVLIVAIFGSFAES